MSGWDLLCCINSTWPPRRFQELGDITMDPEDGAHHSGVYTREVRKATAPTDHTHLDPGTIPLAYQAPLPKSSCGMGRNQHSHNAKSSEHQCPGQGTEEREWDRLLPGRSPGSPSQPKASLMILVVPFKEESVQDFCPQSLFSTMGTATSLRWWGGSGDPVKKSQ